MVVEWSGLAPEILLRLDRSHRGTLGAQLQQHLRDAVRSGRLAAGERLPSTRELARELDISRGLAQDSYEQLIAEGYLIARSGSGTRVAPAGHPAPRAARPEAAAGLSIDFASGVPDVARFPMRDWLWALNEAGRAAPLSFAEYGDAAGRPELRAVARRLPAAGPRRRSASRRRSSSATASRRASSSSWPRWRPAGTGGSGSRTPATTTGRRSPSAPGCGRVPVPVDADGARVRRNARPASAPWCSRRRTRRRAGWS